jgi:hypothetical protein
VIELELVPGEVTELLAEPRPAGWAADALPVGTGPGAFSELHCAGCGRLGDLAELLEWRLTPLDSDRRYLAACYRVCLPCTRRVMVTLEALLVDRGERPLRGRQ